MNDNDAIGGNKAQAKGTVPDDNAYGGARPKTTPKVKDSKAISRFRSGTVKENGLESDSLDSTHLDNDSSSRRRSKRDFQRTNSSDSVFLVQNDATDNIEYCSNIQSRTERNSFEDWDANFSIEPRDWEKNNTISSEGIPFLKTNLVSSESNGPSITNSTISVSDAKSEDPSDLETMEDDCYIYTYKGGTAYLSADLPNSFFRLDSGSDGESLPGVSGAGQSNLSTGVAAFLQDQLLHVPPAPPDSPDEQDFLELDFDPGSDDSESSNDSGQGREEVGPNHRSIDSRSPSPPRLLLEPVLLSPFLERTSPRSSSSRHASQSSLRENVDYHSLSPDLNLPSLAHILPPPPPPCVEHPSPSKELVSRPLPATDLCLQNNNNINIPGPGDTVKSNDCQDAACSSRDFNQSLSMHKPINDVLSTPTAVRSVPLTSPVDEVPVLNMPRSKSLNNNLSGCLAADSSISEDENILLCGNRLLLREALLFGKENIDIKEALGKLSINDRGEVVDVPRSMIWEEKEASRKHVTQLGTSACGATAVMNVLVALNFNFEESEVCLAVKTRLRRGSSHIPDYLLSRSEAGCNHADLIEGVRQLCAGRVIGRFFPMHGRSLNLCSWLSGWISRGCVPVATVNLQRAVSSPGAQIADSWHHQMIWGVSGQNVYLSNHLEVLPEQSLVPQLDSPSELLVRREDIVSRFSEDTDLTPIVTDTASFDQKWSNCNVLGQVINILREENAGLQSETENLSLTPHLRIPAIYESGITLFCDNSNPEMLALLHSTADFPLKGS